MVKIYNTFKIYKVVKIYNTSKMYKLGKIYKRVKVHSVEKGKELKLRYILSTTTHIQLVLSPTVNIL